MIRKSIVSIFIILILSCYRPNQEIEEICQSYPLLCYKLNTQDGQCNKERTSLIFQRVIGDNNPSDLNKFDELMLTKNYARCMETAGQFTVATLKSKRTKRTEALYQAYESIAQLEKALKSSYEPIILFYRSTQGDTQALTTFLTFENTELLNTPYLQLALASIYSKTNKTHTITLLHKSLTLYDGQNIRVKQEVLPEIIKTLATTHHALEKYEHALLWALVGKEFDIPIVKKKVLNRMYPLPKEKVAHITKLAKRIAKKINQGKFSYKDIHFTDLN